MPIKYDLVGQTFHRLTAVSRQIDSNNKPCWLCKCVCGKECTVSTAMLVGGYKKSCGCLQRETMLRNQHKPEIQDITGQKFGRLLAIEYLRDQNNKVRWKCVCECGKTSFVVATRLRSGRIKSCGCLNAELRSERNLKLYKHGLHKTTLYHKWESMKDRCYNHNRPKFENHGGRGIYVCDEWLNDPKAFVDWALINGWEEGKRLHLDRIDNDGPYAPWNCRFVTFSQNNRNMRTNVWVEYRGNKISFKQLHEDTHSTVKYSTAYHRLKRGYSVETALGLPV
jgi:hypothetical protein